MHDVYCFGVIAPSTLIELRTDYPAGGGYAEVERVYPSLGGEAAGSAFVLSRLGIATKLQGNQLSADSASARVLELLSDEGVDCTAVTVDSSVEPITEIVITHGADRTVFGTYERLQATGAWASPSEVDITSSKVVCLDPFFGEESMTVGRVCHAAEVPYVTIDVDPDSELAAHAAVLIVSGEYARRTLDITDAARVLSAYQRQTNALVILTQGGEPLWLGREHRQWRTESIAVTVRDTTGAGDSFRAGVIYGLLQGHDDDELIRTASAVSAMVCQEPPGVLGSPTKAQLDEFLTSI